MLFFNENIRWSCSRIFRYLKTSLGNGKGCMICDVQAWTMGPPRTVGKLVIGVLVLQAQIQVRSASIRHCWFIIFNPQIKPNYINQGKTFVQVGYSSLMELDFDDMIRTDCFAWIAVQEPLKYVHHLRTGNNDGLISHKVSKGGQWKCWKCGRCRFCTE